jgi:hypothetical protein
MKRERYFSGGTICYRHTLRFTLGDLWCLLLQRVKDHCSDSPQSLGITL